jgi:ribosomal-protein-alanine N-acetyltransferase
MQNPAIATLETRRLRLRPWRERDLEPLAALNADPQVMEHFPRCLDRQESEAMAARLVAHFEKYGFGMWSVEALGVSEFIGLVGLTAPCFDACFTPCVEVGWRLAAEFWGRGYATEAARAAAEHGFDQLGLTEIVSYTVPRNWRSRRVMERLGMRHSPLDDFEHPLIDEGRPLRRHVLYRLPRAVWRGDLASHRLSDSRQ